MRKNSHLFIVTGTAIGVLVGLDHASKLWALHCLIPGNSVSVMPGVQWTLAFNRGIAWGYFQTWDVWAYRFLVSIITCMIFGISVALLRQIRRSTLDAVGYVLILSGAIGNLWDRFLWGSVVDFIDVFYQHWHWPVFNLADSLICIGIGCLLLSFRLEGKEK